jgi:surface polysaccharide O-acyltransferase-like enzyme
MRAFYIDHLRIFLTILVIFHHTAIAFGAAGGWYYISNETTSGITQLLLSAQMAINQAFFMSLFFFISALFMTTSYDRKGFSKFISDRLVRLGIPLLFYVIVIHPTLVFFILKHVGHNTGGFFTFCKSLIIQNAEPGPMWFVLTLLVFELFYAIYRKNIKTKPKFITKLNTPSWRAVIAFMLGTGTIAFTIRLLYPVGKSWFGLQFGYFSLYIAMYIAGIIASRNPWLEKLEVRDALPWFGLALLAIPVMLFILAKNAENLAPVMGGMNMKAAFYAFWEPVICVGFSYILLLFFKKYANQKIPFTQNMSGNSYAAYIIHPAIVVFSTFGIELLPVSPLLRLCIVLIISIVGSFGISHLLRMLPVIKRII